MSPFPQSVADSSTSPTVFLSPPAVIQVVIVRSTLCSEVSSMATLGPWIKCPESG